MWKGALLGAANVLFVVIGCGASDESMFTFLVVLIGGAIPGVVTGLLLGHLAAVLKETPRLVRSIVLAGGGVAAVVLLGFAFGFMNASDERQIVILACIPTAVGALLLERWTRRMDETPIPTAQAR